MTRRAQMWWNGSVALESGFAPERHITLHAASKSKRKTLNSFTGVDYLENNCAEEPNKLCEFKRLSGRILKTVDSVYQDVSSVDECRELCLNSPYR